MVDIGKRPAQWDSKARQVLAADSHRPLEQAEKPISLLKGLLRPTKKPSPSSGADRAGPCSHQERCVHTRAVTNS